VADFVAALLEIFDSVKAVHLEYLATPGIEEGETAHSHYILALADAFKEVALDVVTEYFSNVIESYGERSFH
jgi:3-dehydroquinate dehydratase